MNKSAVIAGLAVGAIGSVFLPVVFDLVLYGAFLGAGWWLRGKAGR